MTFQDVFEALDRVGSYLKDLLTFYLAPSSFLRTVANETAPKTVFRLAIYAVFFTVLEFSMFSVAVRQMPTGAFFLTGMVVFEVASSFVYVPAFFAVTKFLGVEAPAKTAIVYALTFRFAYAIVPILFYAAFLTTEDYAFAFLRGVSIYAFLFSYYLMLPLTLAQGIRKRAVASVISVAACLLIFNGLDAIFSLTSTQSNLAVEMSPFFDPIGAEVDRDKLPFGRDTILDQVVKEIQVLVEGKDATERDSLTRKVSQDVLTRLSTFRETWPQIDSTLRETLDRTDQRLKVISDSARFHTTRDLIAFERARLTPEKDVLVAIEAYAKHPTLGTYIPVLQSHTALLKAETVSAERDAEYFLVRGNLIRLCLLTNRPRDSIVP